VRPQAARPPASSTGSLLRIEPQSLTTCVLCPRPQSLPLRRSTRSCRPMRRSSQSSFRLSCPKARLKTAAPRRPPLTGLRSRTCRHAQAGHWARRRLRQGRRALLQQASHQVLQHARICRRADGAAHCESIDQQAFALAADCLHCAGHPRPNDPPTDDGGRALGSAGRVDGGRRLGCQQDDGRHPGRPNARHPRHGQHRPDRRPLPLEHGHARHLSQPAAIERGGSRWRRVCC